MWTATLDSKEFRTDGGIDFLVTFSDGNRKYQKRFTFFNQFDLGEVVKHEIASIQTLNQLADSIQLGVIAIPSEKPSVANQTVVALQLLQKLKTAASLGLVDDIQVFAQANIVKQSSDDFLSFL